MALQIQEQNPYTEAKEGFQTKVEKAKDAYQDSNEKGFIGKIKSWWANRTEKNRASAEAKKAAALQTPPRPLVRGS